MTTAWIPLLLLMVAIPVALAIFKVQQRLQNKALGSHGFKAKQLLTGNEVDFYHRLRRTLGPRWVVFPQVSMGALIDTSLLPAHPSYWEARKSFSSKICDFVVCDARTLKPVLVIELDDVMHDFDRDRGRDAFVAGAGYRTVRFWSRKKPSDSDLRDVLAKELALN